MRGQPGTIAHPYAFDAEPVELYQDGSVHEPIPDRFPVWLAAFVLVIMSAIFWVGLITIAQWLWLPIRTALTAL